MKRALAERAKQSGLPNGTGPSAPEVGEPLIQNDIENGGDSSVPLTTESSSSNSGAPGPTTTTTSIRHKKRLRESVVKLEEEDEDDSNANAFYLKHQNRALASELRQMKYQLTRLERERDVRRVQCTRAVQSLNTLHTTWSQMEETLKPRETSSSSSSSRYTETLTPEGSSSVSAPLSTGSGTSVEMVGALFNSLATLGSNGVSRIKNNSAAGEQDEDAMDIGESDDEEDPHFPEPLVGGGEDDEDDEDPRRQEDLASLKRVTDNIASRANTLQSWIFTLLQKIENGVAVDSPGLADQLHTARQQVAKLSSKNKTLKSQMKEISRSRDEANESDRRVRRSLYRLASNRVQLKEVLEAIVSSDEDKVAAAEWMEFGGVGGGGIGGGQSISSPVAATSSSSLIKSEETVSSEEVARLQKKILDLEQVASSRDDQIKTVR